jgi:hypothetical protein
MNYAIFTGGLVGIVTSSKNRLYRRALPTS